MVKCLIYGQNYIANNKYKNNSIKFIHCFAKFGSLVVDKKKKEDYYNLGYQCAQKQKHILEKFIIKDIENKKEKEENKKEKEKEENEKEKNKKEKEENELEI